MGAHFFIINFLVSVADCGYIYLFCSYLSKNEAAKFSFMFCYNKILLYISPADLVSCNTSQIFFSAIHTDFLKRFQNSFITSQVDVMEEQEAFLVVRRSSLLFF